MSNMSLGESSVTSDFYRPEVLMFDESIPNEVRFNYVDGAARNEMIDAMYLGSTPTLPWFQPDGSRTFIKHELNQRNNKAHEMRLVDSLVKNSLLYSIRGERWMSWSPGKTFPVKCISWGCLISAVYLSFELFPHHPHIKKSRLRDFVIARSIMRRCHPLWWCG